MYRKILLCNYNNAIYARRYYIYIGNVEIDVFQFCFFLLSKVITTVKDGREVAEMRKNNIKIAGFI